VTQPLAGRSAFRFFAGAAATLVVVGCGKTERHQPDSATVASRQVAPSGATQAKSALPTAPQPGALAKAIEGYSGDELFDLTRRISFVGGTEGQRRCRGNADCRGRGPKRSTRVRVDAVDQQDSLSATTLSPNGVIAVRASNRGAEADSMYNMRPGANFEYFLVVLPPTQSGAKARWRLEELDLTQGKRSHHTVSQGTVTECNHPFRRGARADFKTCATAATIRPASYRPLQGDGFEEPIWFDCALGCCTADPDTRG
jgi:hypothetical protein